MSLDIVKKEIFRFLESSTPEVLVIKGAWGVGKTYTWNKFLLEAKEANKLAYKKYSYVSLFGINSLDSFRYTIFEQLINIQLIGTEPSLETFKENWAGVSASVGKKIAKYAGDLPFLKKFFPTIESISFLAVKDSLICVDDFERKGSLLTPKDILGVLSELKERKNCKIILILNDESFDNKELTKEYERYKEKVVDIELHFNPTSKECVNIAYNGNDWQINQLKNFTTQLNIRNIRILKKVQRLAELVYPVIKKYEEEVRSQVLHSLCFFSLCFYSSKDNEDIPSLEYVTTRGYRSLGLGKKEEKTEVEKKWDSMMQHYQYYVTDELDLEIKKAVLTGYFVENEVSAKASLKNKEIIASKSEGSFTKAWELYHNSFENNQDEVVNALFESLITNAENVSLLNLNGTVTLFRELGENEKATKAIDGYIEKRKNNPKLFDLESFMSNPFSSEIDDPEIREKFKEIYTKVTTVDTVETVLSRLAYQNGWNDEDIVVLKNTSSNKFYEIFKSINDDSLNRYINTCLKLGRYDSKEGNVSEILRNTTTALREIGAESDINKRRVKKYGIEIE